jgi:asparagine synthase (glutamine-hydrolysing)
MKDPETGNWIVFNGEIYNFKQLRAELSTVGCVFQSCGDTEVVLKAYGRWGADAVERFVGMFAFAIWDAACGRLVMARDRLGVKPVYFVIKDGALLFASELRALLASEWIDRRLEPAGLGGYLALGAVPEPSTMVAGVRALGPGTVVTWDGHALREREYWSLRACFEQAAPAPPQAPTECVTELLSEAVRARLISDAPVGVFLSGGLDSASVTALAKTHEENIRTVSLTFAEKAFSERRFIQLLVDRAGTDHTEVCLSEHDLLECVPSALGAMDQPTFDGINTYLVSGAARQAGVKVALSGVGGDELFGGYPSFKRVPALMAARRWTPALLRRPIAKTLHHALPDTDGNRKLIRWIAAARDLDGRPQLLLRELFSPAERSALLGSPKPLGGLTDVDLAGHDAFNLVSYAELAHYMRNVLLRDTDFMSMAHSLEVREPLLDHRLVEFVAQLPGSVKRNGHGPKALLQAAVADRVPAEIIRRPKMGFTLPFAHWLRRDLGSYVEDVLLDPGFGGQVAEAMDHDAVSQVWAGFRTGRVSWNRPWALFALKIWGQRWL